MTLVYDFLSYCIYIKVSFLWTSICKCTPNIFLSRDRNSRVGELSTAVFSDSYFLRRIASLPFWPRRGKYSWYLNSQTAEVMCHVLSFLLPFWEQNSWHALFWHSFICSLTTPEVETNINTGTAWLDESSNLSNSVLSRGKPDARIRRYKKSYRRQLWNKLPSFFNICYSK